MLLEVLQLLFCVVPTIAFSSTMTPNEYHLRPYESTDSDRKHLLEICKNVYGGDDYLPQIADSYVADESCSFLALVVLAPDEEKLVAVANYKRLSQNSAWIEAVRTHEDFRRQGLASTMIQAMIDLTLTEDGERNDGTTTSIITCTIDSNKGMRRVLEKKGFDLSNKINCLAFSKLKELKGWAAGSISEPQPLLNALDLHHLISSRANELSQSWRTLSTENELLSKLQHCKQEGGTSGYLPGLYEYIVPGPNRLDMKQSLENGLVFVLDAEDKELSTCETNDAGHAILVFTRDERISSLKSNWVCSIVCYTQSAFDSALLFAHSPDVANKLNVGTERKDTPPFCLVFNDQVPLAPGTLAHELPRVDDECVVFTYQH